MKNSLGNSNEFVTRRQYVYSYLYTNIIDLTLTPGTLLSEQEIAVQLNVSRTPVREAIMQLEKDDLVEVRPQIGTYVSLIDPLLIAESKFMRLTLETAVLKEATEEITTLTLMELEKNLGMQKITIKMGTFQEFNKLDDEFHEIIFNSIGKARTFQAIRQMSGQYKRLRILRLKIIESYRWEELLDEHQDIHSAIKKRDAALAVEVLTKHLNKCYTHVEELKVIYPKYFKS